MAPSKATGIFADIMNDINKGSRGGNVQYLKDGDTTVKLVMPAGRTDIRTFYQPFQATFKGELFPYYLVAGVITEADEDGVADPKRVRFIKVTKTIMVEIVNLLQKKWDLFGHEGNRAGVIVITKGKKNGKPSYNVTVLPDSIDATNLPHPEQSIEEAAAEQEASSAELDATGGKGSEGESLK